MAAKVNATEPTHVRKAKAAELLGCSVDTIERLMRTGEITYSKVGKIVLIPLADLEDLLKRQRAAS